MIELKNAELRRGGQVLLKNANLTLHRGQRIGLTGNNGVGKSTFFALILGQVAVDAGDFFMPTEWQIAHMAQEVAASSQSALDYVLAGDEVWYELNKQMQRQETFAPDAIIYLHEQFEQIDGYRTPAKAAEILAGLGFAESEHTQAVAEFSGGWRMRLNLARTLMHRADVLLLDEPTNHLDLDAILWLEDWLRDYEGLVLLISHDQLFLDAVVGHILHIEQQTMTLYRGNYSQFVQTRNERRAQAQVMYVKQETAKAHLEDFIRRFRAKASKAKQAQSRIKQLERMEMAPLVADNAFAFHFYEPTRMASPLLQLDRAVIGYDVPLLEQVNLTIGPDTSLGILGANGAGKSTLVKTLVGELPLLSGSLMLSDHLQLGYFNQHQTDSLDMNAAPLQLLRRQAGQTPDSQLRAFLGGFDFRGDKIDTPIAHFSGGERARLALALIIWQRPNVLILDEPTNHLDLQMRQALMLALQDFVGALVLVSHDRELVLGACDELLLVGQGRAEPFTGDMHDYARYLKQARLAKKQATKSPSLNAAKSNKIKTEPKKAELSKEQQRKHNADTRKKTAPLRKAIEKLEIKLEQLSAELAALDGRLADDKLYHQQGKDELLQALAHQANLTAQLRQSEEQLLDRMSELEALETVGML